MPIIPPDLLNCVFYLYKNKKDADAGSKAGGTGFFIAMPTPDGLGHHYGVTNWHVAVSDGFSCIRINTLSGPEVFEFDPADWIFNPGQDDIAIVPLSLRTHGQIAMFISSDLFMLPHHMLDDKIGPGDDVFMVGRFVDLDMKQTNIPSVRFGNISTRPVAIKQPTNFDGPSFCIDMHSRTGYSGSPVFVYRTPGQSLEWVLKGGPVILSGGSALRLLGIHWGQFHEELAIKRGRKQARHESTISRKLYEEYIEGMSGMTCVIPAWRISELLNGKKLSELRTKELAMREKQSQGGAAQPVAESSPKSEQDVSKARDEILRTMLSTPPQPRAQPAQKRVKRK